MEEVQVVGLAPEDRLGIAVVGVCVGVRVHLESHVDADRGADVGVDGTVE